MTATLRCHYEAEQSGLAINVRKFPRRQILLAPPLLRHERVRQSEALSFTFALGFAQTNI